MAESKHSDSDEDWNTNEDKRIQCLQVDWVAILSNLPAHLARIFAIVHQDYGIRVTHCSILPENSHRRSKAARNSNTTTIFIRARDDSYVQLKRLFNRYRFHEHGWETQTSEYVFTKADEVRCQLADCIECNNFNARTPGNNYNKYSCSNTIDITEQRISAHHTTPPNISQKTNNTITAPSTCTSTPTCSICLSPTAININKRQRQATVAQKQHHSMPAHHLPHLPQCVSHLFNNI